MTPQVGFSKMPEDFSTAMSKFMNLRICEGVRGFHQIMHCGRGHLVNGIWRSKTCEATGNSLMCLPCKKLHFKLEKKLLKSPNQKKRVVPLKVNVKYYKAKAKRLSLECRNLRRDLVAIKKSLREIDLEDIKQRLQAMNLAITTQSAVLHALQTAQVKSSKGMRYPLNIAIIGSKYINYY